jgi:hypothetical protein
MTAEEARTIRDKHLSTINEDFLARIYLQIRKDAEAGYSITEFMLDDVHECVSIGSCMAVLKQSGFTAEYIVNLTRYNDCIRIQW